MTVILTLSSRLLYKWSAKRQQAKKNRVYIDYKETKDTIVTLELPKL